MKNVLIISGHPNLEQSTANATLLKEIEQLLPEAEIRYLDKLYPTANIDVAAEQAAMVKADIIVWQYPLYWCNVPSLLKKWLDDTFEHGFAYGTGGDKLHGKKFLLSFTTSQKEQEFQTGGAMNFPIDAFTPPFRQVCFLSGMEFQENPVSSHGMLYIPGVSSEEDKERVIAEAKQHAHRLAERLKNM